jgi:hypothetical protein
MPVTIPVCVAAGSGSSCFPLEMSAPIQQVKATSGQFCRFLRSLESAHDDAAATGRPIPSDKTKPVTPPPDPILRAYADLLSQVLLLFRGLSTVKGLDVQEVHDLADAVHNLPQVLVDYGAPWNDEQYREYLRAFDRRWAHEGFGLEQYLESRLRRYS